MKSNNSIIFIYLLALLFFSGCSEQIDKHDFIVTEKKPASALTIGWYVSPEIVQSLVGDSFIPKVVNAKKESSIFIYIVQSEGHIVDGIPSGLMEAAHLLVPVESTKAIETTNGNEISNLLVCPITIVEQSQRLGNKYNDFGFKTYSGEIDLRIDDSGTKQIVEAVIKTNNGTIQIKGMFEEEKELHTMTSAIISEKTYFGGSEQFTRISNGKGSLKTDGTNMISAMNLDSYPFYLKLDNDISWAFDFEKLAD